ncbi:hypothetical protein GCM10007092_10020 [Thermus composti]|uniref:Uncharacterized protein n=1 Tax=Thermus composti TaxID=532059 RepID=A0ABV6Q1J6_9DEIN|nr:hypothetical protein [Thermus composti]GGM98219.1 hypothetical protein GCM10007092_10020 [Thermus composti]
MDLSAPRPLLLLHRGGTPLFDRLVAEVARMRLPLFPYPLEAEDPWALLPCLRPLGFAGMVLAEGLPPGEGVRLEAEAEAAGLVDLLAVGPGGVLGQFTEGLALERFLSAHLSGAKALWVGPLRLALAPFLRPLAQVSLLAPSFAEGDRFLARLPSPARGHVALRPEEARALSLRVDLLLYAGGRLPLDLLHPFHALLALVPPDPRVRDRVQVVYGPEALWDFRVWAVLAALGYPL